MQGIEFLCEQCGQQASWKLPPTRVYHVMLLLRLEMSQHNISPSRFYGGVALGGMRVESGVTYR